VVTRRVPALLLAAFLLVPLQAFAQSGDTATALANTPVYLSPGASDTPLRVASRGTTFEVLGESGEWTQVRFQDPQWGPRTGYVATKDLRMHHPGLEPMDLSVRPPTAPEVSSAPTARVAPSPAVSHAPTFERGWIDVNLGAAVAGTRSFTAELETPLYGETSTARVTYSNPLGADFDFGGGVMLTPTVGLGISFSGTAHQDTADLFINVPHPILADAFAADERSTDSKLMRVEGGAHLQVMGVAPIGDRMRVRLFGGPSWFRVQQDMVRTIRYDQTFVLLRPVNAVDITTFDVVDKVEASGWGFHVGGDFSVFFSRVVGVGAIARYSHATVTLDDPLSGEPLDVTAGGFQVGGGLRLKF
jgi:hypothetical protein